jgi:hypothetical protein
MLCKRGYGSVAGGRFVTQPLFKKSAHAYGISPWSFAATSTACSVILCIYNDCLISFIRYRFRIAFTAESAFAWAHCANNVTWACLPVFVSLFVSSWFVRCLCSSNKLNTTLCSQQRVYFTSLSAGCAFAKSSKTEVSLTVEYGSQDGSA